MKIEKALPPNYEAIAKAFDLKEAHEMGVIFTYGDTIYAPHSTDIPKNVIVHEEMHEKQQATHLGGPAAWWDEYIANPQFRFEQEIEAYGRQYAFIQNGGYSTRQKRFMLYQLGGALSSPMYGELVRLPEAESKIRNAAKASTL